MRKLSLIKSSIMYVCGHSPQKNLVQKSVKMLAVFLLFFAVSFTSKAQLAEFYYGLPDRDEVANDIKRTANGSAVIVGYSASSSSITTRDFLITLINPSGNVVWSRTGGTDLGDVFDRVIVTANGNFVAVGYSNENTNGNAANSSKRALIVCYDVTGNLLWSHQYRLSAQGSAGDRFNNICELSNGNLVASGAFDQRGNFSDGLVAYMDASGNPTGPGFRRFTMAIAQGSSSNSDEFIGIVASGNEVYLSGLCGDGNQYDGVVTHLDASANVIFSNRYTYNAAVNGNQYNWFTDIFIRDNQLLINAYNTNDYVVSTSSLHGVVSMDLNGNSPQVADIENFNYTTNKFCNTTDFYPITATDYFTVENPASNLYATHSGHPGSDATISRLDASIPSISLSRSIPRAGEQTLNTVDVKGSIVTMAGAGNNDPNSIGGYDIYMLSSDFAFTTNNDCELQPITIKVNAPLVSSPALSETILILEVDDVQDVSEDQTQFDEVLLCGTIPPPSGDCDDKCYWKLEGNNSVSPTNFLGSINSEDLRLSTTNQTRVTIEKDYGNVGIGVHPNQKARLLIDHDGTATTFPVFFKLQYQAGTDYYRISKSGTGSTFTPLIWAHKASTNNDPAIKTVGSIDFANDNTSDEAIQEFKSFLYDGNVSVASPTQRLLFNFGDLSTNYMKMSYNGYMGIGLQTNATYPTARLHVDCIDIDADINNPSNIRFENLQVQDAPYILVMDDAGYVFRTDNPNYNPDGGMIQQNNTGTTSEVAKLQKEVDDLKALVYELSKQKTEQSQTPNENATDNNASLTPYLIDNVPNPYSQSTLIRYYLPAGTTNAAITITNNEGIVLETVTLAGEGMGTLMYNASGLADGTYSYTLMVGGQKIDTKKMLITR
jgi:hypothetical protein